MLSKKGDFFMYQKILLLTLSFVLILVLIGILPIHGEEQIYETAVRLHVIANSDSEEDQRIKLKVRDAVLAVTDPLLAECKGQKEALQCLGAHTAQIEEAARSALQKEGVDDTVTLTLTRESYPQKNYDAVCFPAGEYVSLQIRIGSGEGKNWWCCLFPPLCLGAASSSTTAEDAFISVGLTPSQYQIITETDRPVYRVRFKILELLSSER